MANTVAAANRLIDRHAESARLDELLAEAKSGTSGAVILRGEAGIGKTALLDRLIRDAAGCRIVRASGVESEMELPFAALHQLCAPFLDGLERLPGPQRVALSTAFGLESGPVPDRFFVGLAVLTLLADLADKQPLICLVDDAQWLDRVSAQVLGFVARRLAAESVVMIFAVRESAEPREFAGLPELALGPLDADYSRHLLRQALPGKVDDAVRDRILAEAHGNPLALLELPRGWTSAAFAGGFGLPDSASVSGMIDESFRRRLSPLPDDSKQLMLLAAAEPVGDPPLLWAAAAQLGISPDAAVAATSAGLLEIGVQVRFRHPMVRSLIYREASSEERRLAHGALAEVTDSAHDPDRRAWHRAAATDGIDDDVALELERSATRAQARGGVAAAAAFLERAVGLTSDPEQKIERALMAAQAKLQAAAFNDVLTLLATAEAGGLNEFQSARASVLRGHTAFASGMGGDAPTLLLEAARRLEPFSVDLARETYLTAWGAAFVQAHAKGEGVLEDICQAVLHLPAADGDPGPLELVLQGLALLATDGHRAAAPVLRRAASAVLEIPLEGVLKYGWVATAASAATWDYEGLMAIATRQVQMVRDAGAVAQMPLYLSQLCRAHCWIGDLAGAEALMTEEQSVAAATGRPFGMYGTLTLRAPQGRESETAPVIASAIAQADAGRPGVATHALWASAVLYNGLGRYAEAMAAAKQAAANTFEPFFSMWSLPELVEAAARSGDAPLAEDALVRLIETTEPVDTDFARGVEARSRALLAEGPAAEALYRESVDCFGRTELRPELARSHLVYGEWLRREGRRVDARAQLRAAYDEFTRMGMEAFEERARRELVATGEHVRRRGFDTQDQLTPQELQIARLASEGLTNPEIGAQLFLSRRTVEWHLRKVYDKLEVHSRWELSQALSGAKLTTPQS